MRKYEVGLRWLILSFLFPFSFTYAFSSDFFHRITEEDGLSDRMCFSVQQDKHGFMWISTKLGVDRFDGKVFRHYLQNPFPDAGYDRIGVNYLRYSPDSTLWVFNEAGLIYQYDERRDGFELIYEIRNFFNNHSIILNDIMFDSPERILLSTSKGVLILNLTNRTSVLMAGTEQLAVNRINKNGSRYYFSTGNGLYITTCSEKGAMEILYHCLGGKNVLSTYLDMDNGRMLIGTLNAGIYSRSIDETGDLQKLPIPIAKPIRSIVSYTPGKVAVGVDLEGVFILDRVQLKVEKQYVYNETSFTSISSNNVRGLFVDDQYNLWVATYHGGVSFQDSFKLKFNSFQHRAGDSQSVGNDVINAVMEDSSGNFWFGTNNGVSMFSVEKKQWRHYFNKNIPGEKGDAILTMAEDSQGNIWVGGYSFGVACIDRKTGKVKKYWVEDRNPVISTNYIYSIYADGDLLWFGGIMGNVTSLNVKTGRVNKYDISKVNYFERLNDRFLVVGLFNGLFILNKETGEIKSTAITKGVTTMHRVQDGVYWVGTINYGMYFYDVTNDSIRQYTMQDHLSSDYIYGIAPDRENNLWIATENGLNKLSLATGIVEVFDKQDGLPSNQFKRSSCYVCCNGNILLGSADGAILFNPREIKKTEMTSSSETIIYQFDVFNEPVYCTDEQKLLNEPIYQVDCIRLPYNRNFFSFHFVTPNFQTPQKTLYSYYLEGHDLSWSVPASMNMITYSKVAPGNYTFHVKSVIDGVSQQEKKLEVIVAEPWWNTVWAKIIYFLLFTLLLVYIYRMVKQRQEKRSTEAKIDFFVTTAHDLLTPLNLIQAPLKDLENEISPSGEGAQLLNMALNNSAKLAHYVERLLDFQRVSLDASRLVVSRQILENFLRHRLDSFKLVAGNKYIHIENRLDDSTRQEIWFDKEKITRILDNLLSNAIKYTPYGGKISIEASVDQHKWYLRIKDTGIGISSREQRHIFKHIFRADNAINSGEIGSGIGLKLVGALVKLHQGKISFRSKVGEGTEFLLSFPLTYETTADYSEMPENTVSDHGPNVSNLQVNRVMIVEDDSEMSHYIEMSLRDIYRVKTFNNAVEALDSIEVFSPRLIISDVLMPGMTGFEFCQKVKSNVKTSHIPFLLLTGVTDKKSMLEGIRLGAIDYIMKPFDKEVLRSKIANIFELQQVSQKQCLEELKNNNAVELSNKADNEFMDKLLRLIEANMDNPELNISLMCGELAMSRTLLYNKITQLTGKAPTEFIRIFRLKHAAALLLSGEYSVTDVAFKVGIDNPKYFSRIFKEFYGVSPKEYLAKENK